MNNTNNRIILKFSVQIVTQLVIGSIIVNCINHAIVPNFCLASEIRPLWPNQLGRQTGGKFERSSI